MIFDLRTLELPQLAYILVIYTDIYIHKSSWVEFIRLTPRLKNKKQKSKTKNVPRATAHKRIQIKLQIKLQISRDRDPLVK